MLLLEKGRERMEEEISKVKVEWDILLVCPCIFLSVVVATFTGFYAVVLRQFRSRNFTCYVSEIICLLLSKVIYISSSLGNPK